MNKLLYEWEGIVQENIQLEKWQSVLIGQTEGIFNSSTFFVYALLTIFQKLWKEY